MKSKLANSKTNMKEKKGNWEKLLSCANACEKLMYLGSAWGGLWHPIPPFLSVIQIISLRSTSTCSSCWWRGLVWLWWTIILFFIFLSLFSFLFSLSSSQFPCLKPSKNQNGMPIFLGCQMWSSFFSAIFCSFFFHFHPLILSLLGIDLHFFSFMGLISVSWLR